MKQNAAITVKNVTMKFKGQVVLNDINIDFEMGKIYGIIGRNGSGKTVLLKCICGLLLPTAGTVTVNDKIIGRDVDFPENTGFIIENPAFLQNYSALKNLKYLASIKGKIDEQTIRTFIKLVGLNPDDKKAVGKYSLGMRQRLGIAQALMENPDIIILDEPMVGLDPRQILEIRTLLGKLAGNHTILLSSHILSEVDTICDQIMIIANGRLVASDSPEGLKKLMAKSAEIEMTVLGSREKAEELLHEIEHIRSCTFEKASEENGIKIRILTEESADIRGELSVAFTNHGMPVLSMRRVEKSLEDIFLQLTETSEREEEREEEAEKDDCDL